ncbi:MAG: DUF763 domain-containing protein [Candidatus Saliniplasma sp.]
MRSKGTVDLPLHGGRTPRWLFEKMVELSRSITEVIIDEYGKKEFLERITDPYWFQALSCTIGFDWHSSGTTTTTCGALKVALDPEEHGIAFLGGKGKASMRTPEEIRSLEEHFQLSPKRYDDMSYTSKMIAKVDNTCIQDRYSLYHHSFILAESGDWGVIQQGMNDEIGYARRYHWLSNEIDDLLEDPHKGVCCDRKEIDVLNMTDRRSEDAKEISVDLINDDPEHLRKYFRKKGQTTLTNFHEEIEMPSRHQVLDMDISKKGWSTLERAYEIQPTDYEELISLEGMGPKKIRALALVSDLIYGSEPSWKDPVKYSFAHGGKDGTPFPVDEEIYNSTIDNLKTVLEQSEVREKSKKNALKRLNKLI